MKLHTVLFALAATGTLCARAASTSLVDYGQQTQAPNLDLLWKYETETSKGTTYAVITGVETSEGKNPSGALTIPTSLAAGENGPAYIVKKIADGALADQIGVTSVSLPITIEEVGDGVFADCTVLSEITVDSGNPWITTFNGALYDKDLTTLIACPACTETLVLAPTVTNIAALAFADCHRLVTLDIPASVESIGSCAFKDCKHLTSITFDGDAPAANGTALEGTNENLILYKSPDSIGWDASPWTNYNVQDTASDQQSGILSVSAGLVIWRYRVAKGKAEIYNNGNAAIPTSTTQTFTYNETSNEWVGDGRVVVPSSLGGYPVTRIGDGAFKDCAALKQIEFPDSIREMGYRPIAGSSITSLALPSSIRKLDGNPLAGCDETLSVSIPDANSYFAAVDGVLYDKDALTLVGCPARTESVTVGGAVTQIGPEAFDGCFRLSSIALPDSLTAIGDGAFQGMTRLGKITIPANVTSIGERAFANCSALTDVTFEGNAPDAADSVYEGTSERLTSHVKANATGFTKGTWKGRAINQPGDSGQTTTGGTYYDGALLWTYEVTD